MSEEKVVRAALPPAPDLSVLGPPPKRKKGRPPKNRALLPGGESSLTPAPPKLDGRGRKPKQKNGDVVWPAVDSAYVGQPVHGVLDGSFDAGYLLTVRVGNTQTVLRGAVFEPSLSVPISEFNDIAPHVKFVSRGDLPVPPLPCLTEHANVAVAAPSPLVVPRVSSGSGYNNIASVRSPSIVPPANSGNDITVSKPMEDGKRHLSKAPSAPLAEFLRVPTQVAAEIQKDMTPSPVLSGMASDERKGLAPPYLPFRAVIDDQKVTAPPQVLLGVETDEQKATTSVRLEVATEGQKGMAPPVQYRDHVNEEKADMHVEPPQS